MANLTEAATYDAGVYQIETTDPVTGGAAGIANKGAINLANRTKYLKIRVDAIEAGTMIPPTVAPLASPVFTGNPTAPTPAFGDDDTSLATTAFVQATSSAFAKTLLDDTSATAARGTLGAAASGANTDITSLSGLTTALSLAQGGSGSATAFASSLQGTGYQKLPGGLIIQWGDISTNSSSDTVVTFPVAFTSAVYSRAVSCRHGVSSNSYVAGIGAESLTQMGVSAYYSATGLRNAYVVSWIAIGK